MLQGEVPMLKEVLVIGKESAGKSELIASLSGQFSRIHGSLRILPYRWSSVGGHPRDPAMARFRHHAGRNEQSHGC